MATITHADRLHAWSQLARQLETLGDELPELAELRRELVALLAEAERLEVQKQTYTALLRQVNQDRARLQDLGQEVRARIGDGLRSHLGPRSAGLLQFGFRPRTGGPRRRRGAAPSEVAPDGEPT